jgi:hypothetical protein
MPIDREFPITMFDYLSVSPEKKKQFPQRYSLFMVKSPYVPSKFIVDPNWPSKVKPITAHNPTRDPKIVRLSLMCVLLTQNVLCSWIPTFNLESTFLLVWSISYFIPHNWHYSSKSLCLPTWLTSPFLWESTLPIISWASFLCRPPGERKVLPGSLCSADRSGLGNFGQSSKQCAEYPSYIMLYPCQ